MDEKKRLKINVPSDRAEARYSDFTIVAKNVLGFNIDFAQRIPGGKHLNLVARIAMSPQHAKLFHKILEKNIEQYEKKFGEIKMPEVSKPVKNQGVIHFTK